MAGAPSLHLSWRSLLGVFLVGFPAVANAATGCDCSSTFSPTKPVLTCTASGDPHYTTFVDEHYNFMGKGIYRHASLTTDCGCEVEVQTFLGGCGSGGYLCAPGASAIGAMAMRLGSELTFTTDADGKLTVSGDGYAASHELSGSPGVVGEYGGATVEREARITGKGETAGAGSLSGWRISIPGGGSLLAYSQPTHSFPTGGTMSVWLSVPHADLDSEADFCTRPCGGTPPIPYPAICTTTDMDRCLPIFSADVLFDASLVAELEATFSLLSGSASRQSGVPCVTVPACSAALATADDRVQMGCSPNTCRQLSFAPQYQRTGGTIEAYYGATASTSPGGCHDLCQDLPAAFYSTFVPQSASGVNDAECHCQGHLSTVSSHPTATTATLCRRSCTADEDSLVWNFPFHQDPSFPLTAGPRDISEYESRYYVNGNRQIVGYTAWVGFFNSGQPPGDGSWFVQGTTSPAECKLYCGSNNGE